MEPQWSRPSDHGWAEETSQRLLDFGTAEAGCLDGYWYWYWYWCCCESGGVLRGTARRAVQYNGRVLRQKYKFGGG